MKIESIEEHILALVALDDLMDRDPPIEIGSALGDWFGALSSAIETFEKVHFPIPDPTPEEAAAFRASEEPKP